MNSLDDIVVSEIQDNGEITFERFMEIALYDPQFGYYSAGKSSIGKEGDFYTGPSVNPAFGQTLTRFIVRAHELLNQGPLNIIEVGAGKGFLSLDILDCLKSVFPEIYSNLRYTIVEPGEKQIRDSQNLLSQHPDKVDYKKDIVEVDTENEAIAISNELFDALPFHRLTLKNGILQEIYVSLNDDGLCEVTGELSDSRLAYYIEKHNIKLVERQQIEISLRAADMLMDICSRFRKGVIITIDYGYLADELYTPDRPRGTFKCHRKQEINENPYSFIGDQDITAHVDFTNLIEKGIELGLSRYIYREQGQFLIDWGILELIDTEENPEFTDYSKQRQRLAIKNLILPQLMGKVFKVLVQFKNLTSIPQELNQTSDLRLV